MDISADKYKSNDNQSGTFFAIARTVRNLVWQLIGIFTISEEDRSKAGIYLGGEGRD